MSLICIIGIYDFEAFIGRSDVSSGERFVFLRVVFFRENKLEHY